LFNRLIQIQFLTTNRKSFLVLIAPKDDTNRSGEQISQTKARFDSRSNSSIFAKESAALCRQCHSFRASVLDYVVDHQLIQLEHKRIHLEDLLFHQTCDHFDHIRDVQMGRPFHSKVCPQKVNRCPAG